MVITMLPPSISEKTSELKFSLKKKYFLKNAQKNAGGDYTVTFTTNEGIPGTLLGVYSVHVNGSTAVANWSYDGHAGDMDHWDASIIGSLSGGGCGICDEGSLVRTVS